MGYGEDYWAEFDQWFKRKNHTQKREYAARNPEPESWAGFYLRKGVVRDF
jgi:hypothetical protein